MTQHELDLSEEHLDLEQLLDERGLEPPRRGEARTLQLNIGLRCNLACHHCHVESGPKRRPLHETCGISGTSMGIAPKPARCWRSGRLSQQVLPSIVTTGNTGFSRNNNATAVSSPSCAAGLHGPKSEKT